MFRNGLSSLLYFTFFLQNISPFQSRFLYDFSYPETKRTEWKIHIFRVIGIGERMKLHKMIPAAGFILVWGAMLNAQTLNDCFIGYKEHDLELQQLQVKVKQAENSFDRAKADNGTEVNLSTGSMSLELGSGGTEMDFAPQATVSLPSVNGTSVTASIPLTVTTDSSGSATEFDNAEITLSTDIISNTARLAALGIESAERDLTLSQRDFTLKHIAVEESFWNEVRSLYEAAQSLADGKTTLYTLQTDFDEVKVEGYAPYSSTYISARLEVDSAQREVEEDARLLANALGDFAVECGMERDGLTDLPELPASLDSTELADMKNYDRQMYIDLEESIWTNGYRERSRQSDRDFTLRADFGYGWDGSLTGTDDSENELTHSLSAGLSASYRGMSLSAGVSTPLEDPSAPSLLLSLAWDLTGRRTSALDDRDDEYDRQLEILDIKIAAQAYTDAVGDAETDYGDLVWTKQRNSENLAMYKKLYEDSLEWSEKGLIANADLAQNRNSYEQARYTASLTNIDYVLYNLKIAQYFINSENTDYTGTGE